jgi:hypothetical protein
VNLINSPNSTASSIVWSTGGWAENAPRSQSLKFPSLESCRKLKKSTNPGIFIDVPSKVLFDQNRHSPLRLPQVLRMIFVWILAEMLL